ncbi:MAG: hypothetical protein HND58_18860 [Planctomycetota bacterium]|nr:MAG: hypothetical protein HND58_18860 [Planctomycetota bacterium]
MTEQPSDSITTVSTPGTSAPLPGQGTGGCGGLLVGVVLLMAVCVVCTVIGYMIVHAAELGLAADPPGGPPPRPRGWRPGHRRGQHAEKPSRNHAATGAESGPASARPEVVN